MPLCLRIQEAPGAKDSDVADHLDRGGDGLLAGLIQIFIIEKMPEIRTLWIDGGLASLLEVGRGQGADTFGRGLVEDLYASPCVDGVGADFAIQAAAVLTQFLIGLYSRHGKFDRIVDEHRAHRDGATDTDDDIDEVLGQGRAMVLPALANQQAVPLSQVFPEVEEPDLENAHGRARGPMASKLVLVLFVEILPILRRDLVNQHILGQGELTRYAVEPEWVDW
ncbi:hypothetical protein PG997_007477 [Apiospora hydei]|uniref:Uncharacterized protein n=1 Tax=Apiospora hydei TaxID=1337664 RepID=A0ABR1W857_9PEZI